MSFSVSTIPYPPSFTPELFCEPPENPPNTNPIKDDILPLTNLNRCFLLEGHVVGYDPNANCFDPEVTLTEELARLTNIQVFDCIHYLDETHLSEFLSYQKKKHHLKLAIYLIERISKYLPSMNKGAIFKEFIHPSFSILLKKGVYSSLPKWIDVLKSTDDKKLFFQQMTEEDVQLEFEAVNKNLQICSNRLSAKAFLSYLQNHPQILEVYGLINLERLDFLKEIAVTVEQKQNERHFQLCISDREVHVYLFGGESGQIDHYKDMVKVLSQKDCGIEFKNHFESFKESKDYQAGLKRVLEQNARMNEAYEKFNYWLKKILHYNTEINKLFRDWLIDAQGMRFIEGYNELIGLAHRLIKDGHKLNVPTIDQFDYITARYIYQLPFHIRLDKAYQRFDQWLKKCTHETPKDELLLDWFTIELGGEFIFYRNEFIELSQKVVENGTPVKIPTPDEFDTAKKLFNERFKEFKKLANDFLYRR